MTEDDDGKETTCRLRFESSRTGAFDLNGIGTKAPALTSRKPGEETHMRDWRTGATSASAAAALMAALLMGAIPAASQTEVYKAPRTADGKPNLNGIWQALNTANWDLQTHAARPGPVALGAAGATPAGIGVVEGDEIPYLPEAAAKKKENFANRLSADPEIKCYLPGVPRATYMP